MTARYLLCPGMVRSNTDGDRHFINSRQLAHLYGVRLDECLVLPPVTSMHQADQIHRRHLLERTDLIELLPRANGDYKLPEKPWPPATPAAPARPNGCHNRAPFKPVVAMPDGHSFPFRMAMDCQYTLSALGQQDPRCAGCRWRANLP